MSIETILKNLLTDRTILAEIFDSGHKVKNGKNSTYVEVFKNPDMGEVFNVVKSATYDGAKIGVDSTGNIYIWIDDILHSIMEKALNKNFVLHLDYTKNNPILFLSQGMTESMWKKYSTDQLIKRLKESFPKITTIEMVSRPFTTVHTY